MHTRRHPEYDVVVVGARVAGAATAMLLARQGARVLVLERGQPGSDTLSTHALMRPAVLQLHRWGLLDAIRSRTPALHETVLHYGGETVSVPVKPTAGVDALYAPRRTVLDPLLVQAAVEAGADVRHGHTVTGLTRDHRGAVTGVVARTPDGSALEVSAPLTVGADGRGSRVARAVDAPTTWHGSARSAAAYAYWEGLASDRYSWHYRPGVSAGVIPTGEGLACLFVGAPPAAFRAAMAEGPQRGYARLLSAAAPELADAVAGRDPHGGFRLFAGLAGWLRRPWGAGWALVGDAGYFKDPLSTHGITDALRDAELLADAFVAGAGAGTGSGAALADALAGYERVRDELSMPLARVVERVASYDWDVRTLHDLLLDLSAAMRAELAVLADRLAPAA